MSLINSLIQSFLNYRQGPLPGLSAYTDDDAPRLRGSTKAQVDPYARELQSLYPLDTYSGGRWYDLPKGRVRAWKVGSDDAPKGKVLLIHGLSVPAYVWYPLVERLTSAGYQVGLFDLYGRGYSDTPQGAHHYSGAAMYVEQALAVLDKFGWYESVFVAGHSMGGPIATLFAATFPERVRKVALSAPVGYLKWPSVWTSLGRKLLALSYVTLGLFWPVRRAVNRLLTPLAVKTAAGTEERLIRLVDLQYCILPGYAPVVARSLLHGPIFDYHEPYLRLGGTTDLEVLVLWGTNDRDVSYSCSGPMMKALGSKATLHTMEGAPHDLPTTNPDEVATAMVKFFCA